MTFREKLYLAVAENQTSEALVEVINAYDNALLTEDEAAAYFWHIAESARLLALTSR